jgi:hypothetical protein
MHLSRNSVTMAALMVRLLIASSSPLRDLCLLWDSRAEQPSVDNLYLWVYQVSRICLPIYHVMTKTGKGLALVMLRLYAASLGGLSAEKTLEVEIGASARRRRLISGTHQERYTKVLNMRAER